MCESTSYTFALFNKKFSLAGFKSFTIIFEQEEILASLMDVAPMAQKASIMVLAPTHLIVR
jgi:hypothetical protein